MELRRRSQHSLVEMRSDRQALRVGVAGVGAAALRWHLPEYAARPDVRVVALASRRGDRLRAAVPLHPGAEAFVGDESWRQVTAHRDVDAVSICLPNYLHAEAAIDALRRGKHVLVEKPMCLTLDEADRMIETASAAGAVLMVVFKQRFLPVYRAAAALIRSGRLGAVRAIEASMAHAGPEAWEPSATWFRDPAKAGGGALPDLGIHKADLVLHLTGLRPLDATGMVVRRPTDALEETGVGLMSLEGDALGVVMASWVAPHLTGGVTVICADAVLRCSDAPRQSLQVDARDGSPLAGLDSVEPAPRNAAGYLASGVVDRFIDACLGRCPPESTGTEGRLALELVLAWYRSEAAGTKVVLPLLPGTAR